MKVLVSILGVQKAMVADILLSFLALWATLGAQWRPKATKVDQKITKVDPTATKVNNKFVRRLPQDIILTI